MKMNFEQPEIRLEKFMMEDIITSSGIGGGGGTEDDLPFVPAAINGDAIG
ncbi:MAG: hypothetical protein J6A62_06080 [Oscillospiraceae bacterium]|nr:hypothetical protein [Oscillospiraceae bacterium]